MGWDTVYIDEADTYCELCAPEESQEVFGGRECDAPEHCSICHRPLEYSLTPDGVWYVIEAVLEALENGLDATVYSCYEGTYYEDSPHFAIVEDWVKHLSGYGGLSNDDAAALEQLSGRGISSANGKGIRGLIQNMDTKSCAEGKTQKKKRKGGNYDQHQRRDGAGHLAHSGRSRGVWRSG